MQTWPKVFKLDQKYSNLAKSIQTLQKVSMYNVSVHSKQRLQNFSNSTKLQGFKQNCGWELHNASI